MDCPEVITDVRVGTTVEPEVSTLLMLASVSSMLTVKAEVSAVVDERTSS